MDPMAIYLYSWKFILTLDGSCVYQGCPVAACFTFSQNSSAFGPVIEAAVICCTRPVLINNDNNIAYNDDAVVNEPASIHNQANIEDVTAASSYFPTRRGHTTAVFNKRSAINSQDVLMLCRWQSNSGGFRLGPGGHRPHRPPNLAQAPQIFDWFQGCIGGI